MLGLILRSLLRFAIYRTHLILRDAHTLSILNIWD